MRKPPQLSLWMELASTQINLVEMFSSNLEVTWKWFHVIELAIITDQSINY